MATETQEQTETDANAVEWATKVDVQKIGSKVEGLALQFQRLVVEVAKLQAGQKWIAWILGVMCAALMAIFGTLIVIALQL